MARKPEPWPPSYEDEDVHALQALVRDPLGKKVLDFIIYKICGTYERSASENPYDTYFKEGRRDAGRQLVYLLSLNMSVIEETRKQARAPRRR